MLPEEIQKALKNEQNMQTLSQRSCCWFVSARWMASAVFSQGDTYTVRPVVPQTMWTETYRAGPYTKDEQIHDVTNPAKYRHHSCPIRLPSTTFNEYCEFFKENKGNVRSLLVLGVTNEVGGFYDRRKVIDVELRSRYIVPEGSYAVE